MGVYIKNWSLADWKELLKWAKIGANNAMIGEFTEVEELQPHGRLIDADALLERFEKEEKAADEHGRDFSFSFKSGGENCTEWWPVQQMLMDAPTIIPAEEGE